VSLRGACAENVEFIDVGENVRRKRERRKLTG
jgi:hypothetical protein